ncbi:hypothetical protein THASP1DRAFT_24319 [Thamnocephalis sphaerospora]|uniref:RRM domain-containing protein n=1 Tax=Thamnocephalis sphaerospora TaxID=78915 RepID=A0A4P9XQI6_9FUNG|nr:hypothetical protein THASP1DRAFT_24319 [Thamnocephalis sphaerospora]|eukprot:RKP07550.1 hypothetical protein THASP1DRAFT_24319 [Thamnocephalis sphaerospora]
MGARAISASARQNTSRTARPTDPKAMRRNWARPDKALPIKLNLDMLQRMTGSQANPTTMVVLQGVTPSATKRDLLYLVRRAQVDESKVKSTIFQRGEPRMESMGRACITFDSVEAASLFIVGAHNSYLGGRRLHAKFTDIVPFSDQLEVSGASGCSVLLVGMPPRMRDSEVYRLVRELNISIDGEPTVTLLPSTYDTAKSRFVVQLANEEEAHRFVRRIQNYPYLSRNGDNKYLLEAEVIY